MDSSPAVLPGYFTSDVPFLSNIRAPGRFVIYAYIFVGLLTAIGVRHICCGRARSLRKTLVCIVIPFLIMVDYYSTSRYTTSTS